MRMRMRERRRRRGKRRVSGEMSCMINTDSHLSSNKVNGIMWHYQSYKSRRREQRITTLHLMIYDACVTSTTRKRTA